MRPTTKNRKNAHLTSTVLLACACTLFFAGCGILQPAASTSATQTNTTNAPPASPTLELVADLLSNPLTAQVATEYLRTGELDPATLLTPENVAHLATLLENPLTLDLIQSYLQTGNLSAGGTPATEAPAEAPAEDLTAAQAELNALLKDAPADLPPGWDAPAATGATPPGVDP